MSDLELLLVYIQKKPTNHCDVRYLLQNNQLNIILIDSRGYYVTQKNSNTFFIDSEDEAFIKEAMLKIDNSVWGGSVHSLKVLSHLQKQFKNSNTNDYLHYMFEYTSSAYIELDNSKIELRKLEIEYLDQVSAVYLKHGGVDLPYLINRFEADVMLGAFINDEFAGFIGEHDEGSIGLLEVFEKFRGRGVAYHLQASKINALLNKKQVIYTQVAFNNVASIKLQAKLHMQKADNAIYWYSR